MNNRLRGVICAALTPPTSTPARANVATDTRPSADADLTVDPADTAIDAATATILGLGLHQAIDPGDSPRSAALPLLHALTACSG